MEISSETLIGLFDRAGIIAFSFSGVGVGVKRRLDVFGLLVIGIVTASGGGVIRDLLLDRSPLLLTREDYLPLAAAASLVAIPLVSRQFGWLRWSMIVADAVGLGAFATAGALAGIAAGMPFPAVIVLAILTAAGGGVIRDLLADQVPEVLRVDLVATSAAAGGLVVWVLQEVEPGWAALAGALTATSLRLLSRAFRVHLPVPGKPPDIP
jgi:uncharacterized membrane protein YeiH